MSRGDDRTVHAETDEWQIVRYDRSGKWWVERTNGSERWPLTFGEAVGEGEAVLADGGVIHYGRPGGRAFDRAMAERVDR